MLQSGPPDADSETVKTKSTKRRLPAALLALSLPLLAGVGCGSTTPTATPPPTTTATPTTTTTPKKTKSFADEVAQIRTGIVRIEVTTCAGSDIGTGFLLSHRLVATVEHVIDSSRKITIKQNGRVVAHGTVIGADSARDVALVHTDTAIPGHLFQLTSKAPRLGDDVAALGFPLGLPLTVTRGSVSGTDRTIPIEGIRRRSLVQTDAAVNPGNSGGPLITDNGTVVGLVDLGTTKANGLAFAVSAKVAHALLAAWQAAPQPIANSSCPSTPPSSKQASPPNNSGTGSATVTSYTGSDFSILYPRGFTVTAAERNMGSYYDTTIRDGDWPGPRGGRQFRPLF